MLVFKGVERRAFAHVELNTKTEDTYRRLTSPDGARKFSHRGFTRHPFRITMALLATILLEMFLGD